MIILLILIGLVLIFFTHIKINHFKYVEINGNPAYMLSHAVDKLELIRAIRKQPTASPEARERKKEMLKDARAIVCRERQNPFLWFMVKAFNLHFKSGNPLAKMMQVKVIPTHSNPKYDRNEHSINEAILNEGGKTTTKLRFKFPRVGLSFNRELKNNVGIDIYWYGTEFTVLHPKWFFIVNPEVSLTLDNQISQGFNNMCTTLTFEEFQDMDTGANPKNKLNKFFRDKPRRFGGGNVIAGLAAIRIALTGDISIIDYAVDENQKSLKEGMARKAAAAANRDADVLEAEGAAAKVRLPGLAEAAVRTAMTTAMGDQPSIHKVYEAAEIAKSQTMTAWVTGGATPMISIPANQAAPQQQRPQQPGQQPRRQGQGANNPQAAQPPAAQQPAQPQTTPPAATPAATTPPAAGTGTTPTTTT